jgi:hypothetical protein
MQLKNLFRKTKLGFLFGIALGAGSFFAPGAPCMAQVSLAPYNARQAQKNFLPPKQASIKNQVSFS